VELRDARLVDAELLSDFLHRDFAVVIEGDDPLLAGGQRGHGLAHPLTDLGPLVERIRTLGLGRHQHRRQLLVVHLVTRGVGRRGLDGVDANDRLAQALLVGAHGRGQVRE